MKRNADFREQQCPRSESSRPPGKVAALRGGAVALAVAFVASIASPARGVDGIDPKSANEAKQIFNQRCTACHTFGKGVKVGPDLKGVTERREKPWLHKFIRGSSTLIAGGDPTASTLFKTFKEVRMPDWSDLTEDQVTSLLDWFAINGPENQKEPDEINADQATAADVENGRSYFAGGKPLGSKGLACTSCHSVRDESSMMGGSLGPDLTNTYFRYQDRALTLFFKHPCFKRVPDSSASTYLSPEEIFALKSYLRQVALTEKKGAKP